MSPFDQELLVAIVREKPDATLAEWVEQLALRARIVESVGATVVFLPPYSPDRNPIELAAAARTWDDLVEAVVRAFAAATTTFLFCRDEPVLFCRDKPGARTLRKRDRDRYGRSGD